MKAKPMPAKQISRCGFPKCLRPVHSWDREKNPLCLCDVHYSQATFIMWFFQSIGLIKVRPAASEIILPNGVVTEPEDMRHN